MFPYRFGCLGSLVVAVLGLAWSSVAAADCPFGWRPDEAVPGIGSNVNAIVTWDSDGPGPLSPLLVVGGWTRLNPGVEPAEFSGNVAAWDGALWTPLGVGMNERVMTLAVYEGDLYAGGWFTSADGNAVNCLARWDGSAWQDVGNGVSGPAPRVIAMKVYNGMLVLGGAFSIAGGTTGFNNLAMWDGLNWHTMTSGTSGRVVALAPYADSIFAGGLIAIAGGNPASGIAQWSGAGWQPVPNQPVNGMDDPVNSLGVFQGKLIAGGLFTHAAGIPANSIAQWDGVTWSALGDGVTGNTPTVNAMTEYDGNLIVGGRFTMAGTLNATNVAQWDGSTWLAMGGGSNARLNALGIFGGEVVAGGFFTNVGGVESPHLARWGPACERGDMDCSGQVDQADAPLFVAALLDAPDLSTCSAWLANMNSDVQSDGSPRIDGSDIAPFVQAMLNP